MVSTSHVSNGGTLTPTMQTVEISIKGKWQNVRALNVRGDTIIVRGGLIKTAVFHEEQWLATELQDPQSCLRELKKHRRQIPADILSFSQKLPDVSPRYQFTPEWDSVAAIRVTNVKEWWEKLPQETRKNVRRSQKRGVVISLKELDDDLINGIMRVNNDSSTRQNTRFTHYGKSFDQVKKDQSSFLDRSEFICALYGDELVGFLKLVYRGQVASILQLLTKASHADKRPANALLAKAVERCEVKSVPFLTYGMFNYGNKRDSSLREFKIRNGFDEILVPRYFIPVNLWGALCIKTRVHRGLHGILPESVLGTALRFRAKWNDLVNKPV